MMILLGCSTGLGYPPPNQLLHHHTTRPRWGLCLNLTSLLLCITTSLARLIGPLAGFNLHFPLLTTTTLRLQSSTQTPPSFSPSTPHHQPLPSRPSPSFMKGSRLPLPAAAQTWREGHSEGHPAADCAAPLFSAVKFTILSTYSVRLFFFFLTSALEPEGGTVCFSRSL